MKIVNRERVEAQQLAPGMLRRVLGYNPSLMLVEHEFESGAILARHAHPHEQLIYVLSGRLLFHVEGMPDFEAEAGDSFVVAGGVEHGADVLEASVVLDCFTPARQDFLA